MAFDVFAAGLLFLNVLDRPRGVHESVMRNLGKDGLQYCAVRIPFHSPMWVANPSDRLHSVRTPVPLLT